MTQTMEVRDLQAGERAERVGAFSASPEYRLFTARSVAIATLIGTPAAGAMLMALNYRRIGRSWSGAVVLAAGLLTTALAIWIGSVSPKVADSLLVLGLMVGMRLAAMLLQGSALERHLRESGRMASAWASLGIGLLFLVGIWGVVLLMRAQMG